MSLAKPVFVVAILALASPSLAQERVDEQRMAELIEQLGDPKTRGIAASKLLRRGEPAARNLGRLLRQTAGEPNASFLPSMQVLERMGPDAQIATEDLLACLELVPAPDLPLVIHALGELVPYTPVKSRQDLESATRTVITGLSTNRALYERARMEVARLSRRARYDYSGDSNLVLMAMIVMDRRVEREIAAEILGRRGGEALEALDVLRAGIIQRDITEPIRRLVEKTPVRRLVWTTTKRADNFEIKASHAMIAIAPDDPRCAIAYAFRMATSSDPWQKQQDAMTLGRFGSAAAEAVGYLVAAVRADLGCPASLEAITALGMIGSAAEQAIPTLEELTTLPNRQITERARVALRQIRGR